MTTKGFVCIFTVCVPIISMSQNVGTQKQFEILMHDMTGISFKNTLIENKIHNIFKYEYFYNGGGVAIADFDNDGLPDIFFTGNMVENKLYKNKGNIFFEDVTDRTPGLAGNNKWATGITTVDINGDNWIDIYVCYSGRGNENTRRNELFINKGDFVFKESAAMYGLDIGAHTTHAAFFDFDLDGDLDLYLLNHGTRVITEIEFDSALMEKSSSAGDRLLENKNNFFYDISQQAGINGSPMGFGLGIAITDVNNDKYPDIYVTNDYIQSDFLYVNNSGKTFVNAVTDQFQHISHFSMGVDVGDINNDGYFDIFTLDMLPEDNKRQKLLYGPENYEQYALMVSKGFYHQNMRNMLQLNNGNNTFSEIGQLAGVSNTDWSWAPLFIDLDNDGFEDLYITNGYLRDYTNRDFLKFKGDYFFQQVLKGIQPDTIAILLEMTSTALPNYMFKNTGRLRFTNQTQKWLDTPEDFSNGAAFGDLDNDGDMEIIVNRINEYPLILKNNTRELSKHANYLKIELVGNQENTLALGSKVTVQYGRTVQSRILNTTRGYQSSSEPLLFFGLNKVDVVDSVTVHWYDGTKTTLNDVDANQKMQIEKGVSWSMPVLKKEIPIFQPIDFIAYQHVEYGLNDFKRQPLLLHQYSPCGPVLSKNIAGPYIQIFVTGTRERPSKMILIDTTLDQMSEYSIDEFVYGFSNDSYALFFDANGDHLNDLYVASGGYHDYTVNDSRLKDRLYIQKELNKWSRASLPEMTVSTSVVQPVDIDRDGDEDLFVGSSIVPGNFPIASPSYLLLNDGSGNYVKSNGQFYDFSKIGIVTDAAVCDIDQDGFKDLVITRSFDSNLILKNKNGKKLVNISTKILKNNLSGLWNKVLVQDLNSDSRPDFLFGNYGLNSQLKASKEYPINLYYDDYDHNGTMDPFLEMYSGEAYYPFASRDEITNQLFSLKARFTSYADYADATMDQVLDPKLLTASNKMKIETLESKMFLSRGNTYVEAQLPLEVQFSPIHAIHSADFNEDGKTDLLLAGNNSYNKIRMGPVDANYGTLLFNDGNGRFTTVTSQKSGLKLKGDVRSILPIRYKQNDLWLFGINNFGIVTYIKQ